jgi:hypothetical protein
LFSRANREILTQSFSPPLQNPQGPWRCGDNFLPIQLELNGFAKPHHAGV